MFSKPAACAAAAVAIILMLTVSSAAIAHPRQNVTLGLVGGFVDIGSQGYRSEGSRASSISFLNSSIPSSVGFSYSINALVQGVNVSGTAHFQIGGVVGNGQGGGSAEEEDDGEEEDGASNSSSPVSLVGQVQLVGMVPAVGLPLSQSDPSNPLACFPNCTSEIPGFFLGTANITGSVDGTPVALSNVPILIESAYLSPFGGPIFIGTPDGSTISIAATYDSANSRWNNVQTAGVVLDGNGSNVGQFAMKATVTEDLRSGTERDKGQVSLFGFSGQSAFLNSAGDFSGKSVVPKAGSFDCTDLLSGQLGFTLPQNTCLASGSHSSGSHVLHSADGKTRIRGAYSLDWSVPAVEFAGSVQAAVEAD